MMAHALHTFESGHCTRCGMRRGEGRDGLPCLAELRQSIAETEIAKRMARDAPPMPVSDVSVIDDDGEP